jgi:hypothetical protein
MYTQSLWRNARESFARVRDDFRQVGVGGKMMAVFGGVITTGLATTSVADIVTGDFKNAALDIVLTGAAGWVFRNGLRNRANRAAIRRRVAAAFDSKPRI